jgi:hypothetical protein
MPQVSLNSSTRHLQQLGKQDCMKGLAAHVKKSAR